MCGMVSGLGSVIGLPSKEDFMIMISRNFSHLLMMGILPTSVPARMLWERGGLQFRVLGGDIVLFFGWGGEEKVSRPMEFELCFILCHTFKQP